MSAVGDSPKLPSGPNGRIRPTLQIVRNPRRAFDGWIRQYGDPFLVHALNGPIVITGRADLIKLIYGAPPEIFAPFAVDTVRTILGSSSLLLMDGETHKRERHMLMPMFHGDRMKAYAETMQLVAMEKMQQQSAEFLTLPMMTGISLEIIVRTIFGSDALHTTRQLMQASQEVVKKSHPLLFFSKRMQFPFFGMSLWDQFQKARQKLYARFDEVLKTRFEAKTQGRNGHDILSMLLQAEYEDGSHATQEHIREQLMTFLFAGHETSALAMTWAMYHLHSNPKCLKVLRDELDRAGELPPNELAQLPYLKAVVHESLRLNPIVTEVLRLLKAPFELGEYRLPTGMGLAPAAAIAHYNPNVFADPEQFRPERFIERSYSPFEYMPFGGGHRRCIGAAFALFEMAIVLGTLIRRFDFELLETKPVVAVRRSITLGPSTAVRMKFCERK